MRSKFFVYLENEFELAEAEDIVATAIAAIEELVGTLPSFDDKTKFAIAVTGAKLGVSGDGQINAKEKMLIDTVFGQFWKGSMEQVYELLGAAIAESDYELVKSVIQMGDRAVFQLLRWILRFAYIDEVLEDEIANKLDGLFGMPLMRIFFASGMKDVPPRRVKVTPLEAEIVKWFQTHDKLVPLLDIRIHFSDSSKEEVKAALDNLCAKGILYGGEEFILDMYALT